MVDMVLVSERTVVVVVELQRFLEDARRCKCADASTNIYYKTTL